MKHNEDDALYRQILAELKPGADEYDRMVAQKKHPAGLRRRFRPRFGYLAAACVMIAFLVATQILWQTNGLQQPPQQPPQLARQVLPTAGDVATRVAVSKDAPAEIPAKEQRCQQRLVAATMTIPKTEEEVKDSASVKLAPPTDHAEADRAAIVAEVEARVVEALLEQQIAVEVVNETIRHHEDSQQIQCAI